ncbi:uncharacterized protein LOC132546205 [Ylistrum balloti]|uniref:uncharacterized protein LOC132546205 n=1 Tax=Ylistrum balloti TaxID=509963 RepID=UPI002905ED48|nr:uncharacterized protein LOC132546205 [Ylistrum balloti]
MSSAVNGQLIDKKETDNSTSQDQTELLDEIKKIHSLICGDTECQKDDATLLLKESQQAFLEILQEIEGTAEKFRTCTDQREKDNQSPRCEKARAPPVKTLLQDIKQDWEKLVSSKEDYEQMDEKRTSWYKDAQKIYQQNTEADITIPGNFNDEEKRGLQMFNILLKQEIEKSRRLAEDREMQIKKEVDKVKKIEKDKDEQIQMHQQEIYNLKQVLKEERCRQNRNMNALKNEIDTERSRGMNQHTNYKRMEEEANVLRRRLSKVAGAKLTDGNPNITDLNDPNRPMNLGERFRELNDNEWTDAFLLLTEGEGTAMIPVKPKEAISLLLDIVKKCYTECVRLADLQWERLAKVLTQTTTEEENKTLKAIGFQEVEIKDLKNLRKRASSSASENIVTQVNKVLIEYVGDEPLMQHLKKFTEGCIRVSWDMAVQDPPVYMYWNLKKGDPPSERFKSYTQNGSKVKYVVWPCLLLHEGGPLLSKGICQMYK